MSVSAHGWNRSQVDKEATHKDTRRPLILRGAFAGIVVVMIFCGAVLYFLSPNAKTEPPEKVSPRIKTSRNIQPRASTYTHNEPKAGKPASSEAVVGASSTRKRELIPPPQPIDEMVAAITNKLVKKVPVFQNGAEQLIAMAIPSTPGATIPPLPDITDEWIGPSVEKAMLHTITGEEGDSVETLEKKVVVVEAKEEFAQLHEKEGWSFVQYVKALHNQATDDADMLSEAHRLASDLYNDASLSDEDYIKLRDQINEELRQRGLPEINKGENEEE